ncbi:MAG TPA: hypothetical protein PK542_01255 [Treponemataceae bacterium]|nr:hypothetical protein [Treponemataceae bacterium]
MDLRVGSESSRVEREERLLKRVGHVTKPDDMNVASLAREIAQNAFVELVRANGVFAFVIDMAGSHGLTTPIVSLVERV